MSRAEGFMLEIMEISANEKDLILLIRSLGFGKIEEISVQNGQPVFVKQAIKNIMLGGKDESNII